MQSGAIDEKVTGEFAGCRGGDPTLAGFVQFRDLRARDNATAHGLDVLAQRLAHRGVIDDAFFGDMQCGHASGVGLDGTQAAAVQPAQSGQPVGFSAGLEFAQARDFAFVDRHDNFAADFMRDVFLAAVSGHFADPLHREPRLERAGLVIEPRVENAAVVRALVGTDAGFFLQERQ